MRIGILTHKRENSSSQTVPTSVNSLHNVPQADLLGEACPLAPGKSHSGYVMLSWVANEPVLDGCGNLLKGVV